MLGFIAADLRRHWLGALAVSLIVACATALGVAVTLEERALRLGSARAADAFDLVVGAPGSETQLVLSSVFLQAAPLTLMPGDVMAGLRADPRVVWAAPVGFGDFLDDLPIVGTTQDLVDGLGGLAEGRPFARQGDAVIGARVPLDLGASFHPVHGQLAGAGEVHVDTRYGVTGRLAATGTPWDRAILVPVEAVWGTHAHAHGGEDAEHEHEEDDGHEAVHGGFDPAAPIRPEALADPRAPGLPAIVVHAATIADAYNLRQDYRSDATIAVFPAEVLTRLYGTLGDARAVLAAVAGGAQALVAAAILLVVTVQVLQRQKQIGALRAFGAPRAVVFAIVWGEVVLIAMTGVLAGFGLGYAAARILSGQLAAASGLHLPVAFVPGDAARLLALLATTAVIALLPAALAYRRSPAEALRQGGQ